MRVPKKTVPKNNTIRAIFAGDAFFTGSQAMIFV